MYKIFKLKIINIFIINPILLLCFSSVASADSEITMVPNGFGSIEGPTAQAPSDGPSACQSVNNIITTIISSILNGFSGNNDPIGPTASINGCVESAPL